jgi:ppGpp synthetase/RelA/SpoT-type nucleotidyltranferase
MNCLVEQLLSGQVCSEPFVALSRFFCRLKSADSIVEKLTRKGIQVGSAAEIPGRMPDILGFRIIVADSTELNAVDKFIRDQFEVLSRQDRTGVPGEFGERGIEYSARFHAGGLSWPFELQLRTFLQHYWASQSFHLFHKKPIEVAFEFKDTLLEFSEALACAEECADKIVRNPASREGAQRVCAPCFPPLFHRVHLIVIESGEQFAEHMIVELSGHSDADDEAVVAEKMKLYSAFPGAAIVECSCANFLTVHLNEPLVQVSADRIGRVRV